MLCCWGQGAERAIVCNHDRGGARGDEPENKAGYMWVDTDVNRQPSLAVDHPSPKPLLDLPPPADRRRPP